MNISSRQDTNWTQNYAFPQQQVFPKSTQGILEPTHQMVRIKIKNHDCQVVFFFLKLNQRPVGDITTAFNTRNYENSYTIQQKKSEVMKYYKSFSQNVEDSLPITISWNLNAYVEEKKDGLFKRCMKKIKKKRMEDSNFDNIQTNNDASVKYILKNGKRKIFFLMSSKNFIIMIIK